MKAGVKIEDFHASAQDVLTISLFTFLLLVTGCASPGSERVEIAPPPPFVTDPVFGPPVPPQILLAGAETIEPAAGDEVLPDGFPVSSKPAKCDLGFSDDNHFGVDFGGVGIKERDLSFAGTYLPADSAQMIFRVSFQLPSVEKSDFCR